MIVLLPLRIGDERLTSPTSWRMSPRYCHRWGPAAPTDRDGPRECSVTPMSVRAWKMLLVADLSDILSHTCIVRSELRPGSVSRSCPYTSNRPKPARRQPWYPERDSDYRGCAWRYCRSQPVQSTLAGSTASIRVVIVNVERFTACPTGYVACFSRRTATCTPVPCAPRRLTFAVLPLAGFSF